MLRLTLRSHSIGVSPFAHFFCGAHLCLVVVCPLLLPLTAQGPKERHRGDQRAAVLRRHGHLLGDLVAGQSAAIRGLLAHGGGHLAGVGHLCV